MAAETAARASGCQSVMEKKAYLFEFRAVIKDLKLIQSTCSSKKPTGITNCFKLCYAIKAQCN